MWHLSEPWQTNAFLVQCRKQERLTAKHTLESAHQEIESLNQTIAALRSRHAAEVADLGAQVQVLKVIWEGLLAARH